MLLMPDQERPPQAAKLGRGTYRSVYTVLQDDPEFQELRSQDRHVLQSLIISPDCNIARIFVQYLGPLAARTGYGEKFLKGSLIRLQDAKWSYWDARVNLVWIRNGLRYAPDVSLQNKNHAKAIVKCLIALPKSPLISKFLEYYGLSIAMPYPCHTHANGYTIATPIKETETDIETDIETETEKTIVGSKPDDGYTPNFEKLWKILGPLRKDHSKKAASQALAARYKQGIAFETLYTAAKHFAIAMTTRESCHIMHAATFLGPKERWKPYVDGVPPEPEGGIVPYVPADLS